jgi:hypothetical protein
MSSIACSSACRAACGQQQPVQHGRSESKVLPIGEHNRGNIAVQVDVEFILQFTLLGEQHREVDGLLGVSRLGIQERRRYSRGDGNGLPQRPVIGLVVLDNTLPHRGRLGEDQGEYLGLVRADAAFAFGIPPQDLGPASMHGRAREPSCLRHERLGLEIRHKECTEAEKGDREDRCGDVTVEQTPGYHTGAEPLDHDQQEEGHHATDPDP